MAAREDSGRTRVGSGPGLVLEPCPPDYKSWGPFEGPFRGIFGGPFGGPSGGYMVSTLSEDRGDFDPFETGREDGRDSEHGSEPRQFNGSSHTPSHTPSLEIHPPPSTNNQLRMKREENMDFYACIYKTKPEKKRTPSPLLSRKPAHIYMEKKRITNQELPLLPQHPDTKQNRPPTSPFPPHKRNHPRCYFR